MGKTDILLCVVVWWPDAVGGLDFEYACPPCQFKGDNFLCLGTNFSFNDIYFRLQLSRFQSVLMYDMHERKFHQPCSGL